MVGVNYVLSTAVMGLVLAAVAVTLARGVNWRGYTPTTSRPAEGGASDPLARAASVLGGAARNPTTWYVAFFVLVFGFVGGAITLVTSPPEIGGVVFLALGLAFGAVLCGFLVWGIYRSGRYRGLGSAQAAMAGAWALGTLLIVAIAVTLILSSP